ncbi:MAG: OsmC family protein [Acidimicrobiia bacterium]
MTGTLGGALEARGIDAANGKLTSEATGHIGKDRKVLIIESIHVAYSLRDVPEDRREAAERAHDLHADYCPVARSIRDCISITTELEFA